MRPPARNIDLGLQGTVKLLDKKKPDYTDDDTDHMRRVVTYVHRHQAQKRKANVEDSNWRYSFINFSNATHRRA